MARARSTAGPKSWSARAMPSSARAGAIAGTNLFQIKGFPYTLEDLLHDRELVDAHRDGRYVTLRLTSSMYHRFHAPHDCHVEEVTYISGDTWNVNPIALRRVEKLFCKNERAILRTTLAEGGHDHHPGRRSRPCSSPASASIFSMVRSASGTAGRMSFPAAPVSRKDRRWAGSSTGRRSSYSPPTASRYAKMCGRATIIRVGQPLMRVP